LDNEDGRYLLDVTATAGHPQAPRGHGESGGRERAQDLLRSSQSRSRGRHLLLGLAIVSRWIRTLGSSRILTLIERG
jgi:hypothetical protein